MTKPRVYEVHRDDDPGFRYRLRGQHSHNLKGVDCPSCGAWGMTGIQYPSVDLADLVGDMIPRRHLQGGRASEPVNVETLEALRAFLAPMLGPDRPLIPGAQFGPLQGKAGGTFAAFAWLNSWTPLVREPVFHALRDAGFDLTGVPAEIEVKRAPREPLIELEIRPTARIHPSPPLRVCALCGRVPTIRGRGVDGASFDHAIPLQRIREWPTRIFANEALVDFIWGRGLEGVDFVPVELA